MKVGDVIGTRWFTTQNAQIGVVAKMSLDGWRAYIGVGVPGTVQDVAEQEILQTGAKLSEREARGFFPQHHEIAYAH